MYKYWNKDVGTHEHSCRQRSEESIISSWTRVTGTCQPPNTGARNWTQLLWINTHALKPLSHLSSPQFIFFLFRSVPLSVSVCLYVCVGVSMCHMCVDIWGDQKRKSYPWEVHLQAVFHLSRVVVHKSRSSAKLVWTQNHCTVSPAPIYSLIDYIIII